MDSPPTWTNPYNIFIKKRIVLLEDFSMFFF